MRSVEHAKADQKFNICNRHYTSALDYDVDYVLYFEKK